MVGDFIEPSKTATRLSAHGEYKEFSMEMQSPYYNSGDCDDEPTMVWENELQDENFNFHKFFMGEGKNSYRLDLLDNDTSEYKPTMVSLDEMMFLYYNKEYYRGVLPAIVDEIGDMMYDAIARADAIHSVTNRARLIITQQADIDRPMQYNASVNNMHMTDEDSHTYYVLRFSLNSYTKCQVFYTESHTFRHLHFQRFYPSANKD